MTRNLSHRVETSFPIYDAKLKQIIRQTIDFQLSDNVKARILNAEQDNQYKTDENEIAVRAQIETYFYFQRLNNGG
jgi:polyphosphate kinase